MGAVKKRQRVQEAAMKRKFSAQGRKILLFSAIYFISYITRNSYSVALAAMLRETGLGQSLLSWAVTGSLITYGAGQLASGFLGDRFQPRALVLGGLLTTALANLFMAFCRQPALMLAIWCVNGLAQAFLWPPLVRLMSFLFSGETYQQAIVAVTWGGSLGNIALYLGAPALLPFFGVKGVFLAACLCGIGAALVWRRHCPVLPAQPAGRASQKAGGKSPLLLPLVWAILLAIVLQGMLRDGITTWMPVYIDQTFRLGSTFSIFSGTALPLFSLAAIQGASWLHRRAFPNPILCAGVIFGLGAFCGAGLALFPGASPALSIGLSALLTGCMHGINLLLIGVLPAYFKKFGQVSLLSGVLNAFVYIGSALSAYGFAAAAELSGWGAVVASWPVISLCGMAVCLLCTRPWERFQKG